MKLVVGLGNPGRKYENSKHNLGFIVIDNLMKKLQVAGYKLLDNWKESKKGRLLYCWFDIEGEKVELVKPITFMNESGKALAYVKKKHPKLDFNDLYVVHDDLDIELGRYKIQLGKGPKIHNGLQSIYEKLGSKEFWHVRVGIENRGEILRQSGSTHRSRSAQDDNADLYSVPELSNKRRGWISGEKYVLQRFTAREEGITKKVTDELLEDLLARLR